MLKNYLNIALRNLRKRPFYTGINVLGLAVGMACTIIISVYIFHELSYDRFHQHAYRIHRLATHAKIGETEFTGAAASAAVAQTLVDEVPEVEMAVRMTQRDNILFQKDDVLLKEDKVMAADPDFFRLFSFPLFQGDPATVLQAPSSVVMTLDAARRYFDKPNPLGEQILINDKPYALTGIMEPVPANSHIQFDIVYSYLSEPASQNQGWGEINAATYFLLNEHANIKAVDEQLTPLLKKYFGEYDLFQELGYTVEILTQAMIDIHLHSQLRGEFEPNSDIKYLYIFGVIAAFILLIACVNFMNLATARSSDRAREVGIRKTLGSARGMLIRQFLGESLLLSLFSTFLALGLAEILRTPFNQIAETQIQLPVLTTWFLPAVLLLGVVTGLLAGVYPAFYLTRFRPSQVLKGRLASGTKNRLLRNSLVVFQFVISIVLIVCTLMVYEQLSYVRNKELGFDKENVLVLKNGSALGNSGIAYSNTLRGLSEVNNVSFTNVSPLAGYDGTIFIPAVQDDSLGGMTFRDEEAQVLNSLMVSYDYLPTMGIQLREGRNFSRDIAADSANYAIILNEQAVKALGLQKPLGSQVMVASEFEAVVVGVVEDFHYQSLRSQVEPLVLVLSDRQDFMEVSLISDNLPQTLAKIDALWRQQTGGLPLDYSFIDEDFDALFRADQRLGMLFGGFTSLTILIACLGLLALAAFVAEQRTKEIGVRKVMGASVRQIVLLLNKDFTRLVLVAFVVAIPLAYFAVQRWLEEFAYRIDIGVASFLISGVLALFVAWMTVSFQSVRAARANPVKSLRNE